MNEIDTNNIKSAWPTQAPTVGACGAALSQGCFSFGPPRFQLGPLGFLDTNMLVSATQKSGILTQTPNARGFAL